MSITDPRTSITAIDDLIGRIPSPRALGFAGLLGAIDAAEDLLHTDPVELALRDEQTATALREYLGEQRLAG